MTTLKRLRGGLYVPRDGRRYSKAALALLRHPVMVRHVMSEAAAVKAALPNRMQDGTHVVGGLDQAQGKRAKSVVILGAPSAKSADRRGNHLVPALHARAR